MNAAALFLAMSALPAPVHAAESGDPGVASSRLTDMSGTASVRIVKSYRLTREHLGKPVEGASWRKTIVVDRDGQRRDLDLVEFE